MITGISNALRTLDRGEVMLAAVIGATITSVASGIIRDSNQGTPETRWYVANTFKGLSFTLLGLAAYLGAKEKGYI